MLKTLIVDDLQSARDNIKEDLSDFNDKVKIIGEADGVMSAAKFLAKNEVDLVFLDIQMKDGSGFDLLEMLAEIKFKVIFTTAYSQYAIKAIRMAALDYLMKH